jgi:hypothetical protein
MSVSRLLLVLALLAGVPQASAKNAPDLAELARTHGLVTVRIHQTGLPAGLISPELFGAEWLLQLEPVGDKDGREAAWLRPRDPDDPEPGAWIKAGRYRLSVWRGPWPDGPEVEVVAGRVLDLGDLLEVSLGGDEVVLSPLAHPELEGSLERRLEPLARFLVDPEPLRWRPTRVLPPIKVSMGPSRGLLLDAWQQHAREKQLLSSRERIRAITDPEVLQREVMASLPPLQDVSVVDAEGRQYFGAGFGQLRVREPDGTWHSIDTGTLAPVTALALDEGRLVTGHGEGEGMIRERRADGGWTLLRRFAPGESVEDIDRAEGRWWVVVARGDWPDGRYWLGGVSAMSGVADDFSDLAVAKSVDSKPLPRFGWYPRGHVQDGFFHFNARNALWRLGLDSGRWTQLKVKDPVRFNVSPKTGAITVRDRIHLRIFLPVVGKDGSSAPGPDAKPERVKWGIGIPYDGWLNDMDTGWGIGATKLVALNNTAPIVVSKRGPGGQWVERHEAPASCTLVMRDAEGVPRYCATALGTLLRRDESSWTPEFLAD